MKERVCLRKIRLRTQQVRCPDDWRDQKQNLHETCQNAGDIPKPRGSHSNGQARERGVDHEQHKAGNSAQRDSPGPDLKVKKQDDVDRKIVCNKRDLAEYEAANVEQIRQAHLLDVTLGPREQAAGIQHDRADEAPGDKPCADIGHQLRDRQFEDLRVDQSERNDRDCDVYSRPEWPKGRAPVPVKDVIPAKPASKAARTRPQQ